MLTKYVFIKRTADATEIEVKMLNANGKVAASCSGSFCGGATADEPGDWPMIDLSPDYTSPEAAVAAARAVGIEMLEAGRPFAPYTLQPDCIRCERRDPAELEKIFTAAGYTEDEEFSCSDDGSKVMVLKKVC